MADLALAIGLLREENAQQAEQTIKATKENKEELTSLNSSVGDLVNMFRGKILQDEEDRRERANRSDGPSGSPTPPPAPQDDRFDLSDLLGIGAMVAAVTGAIAGTIAGIIQDIKNLAVAFKNTKAFKNIARIFQNIKNAFTAGTNGVRGLSRAADGAFRPLNRIEKFINGLGKTFTRVAEATKNLRQSASKSMTDAVARIKTALTNIKNAVMKPINYLINGVKSVKDILGGAFKGDGLSKMFQPMKDFFARFKNIFGKFFQVFKNIGSKIFFPITVIMGIFDGITGAIDGWNRQGDRGGSMGDKIIGALTGALGGIVSGIVGGLLDMAKSLISWIAGKLGFSEAEKFLDSFSFAEGITQIFNGIADWLINIKDRMVGWFGDMYDEIITPLMNIFKGEGSLVDNVLSILDGLIGNVLMWIPNTIKGIVASVLDAMGVDNNLDDIDIWTEIKNKFMEFAQAVIMALAPPDSLIGKTIVPSSLYEWAGINPDSGEVIGTAGQNASATRRQWSGANETQLAEAEDQYTKNLQTAAKDYGKDSNEYKAAEASLAEIRALQKKAALDANKEYSDSFDAKSVEAGTKRLPEVPAVREKEMVREDMDRMDQENRQAAGAAPVVIAPSNTQVNNNSTSTTAAIVDTNAPTRDYNDRVYSMGGELWGA